VAFVYPGSRLSFDEIVVEALNVHVCTASRDSIEVWRGTPPTRVLPVSLWRTTDRALRWTSPPDSRELKEWALRVRGS
jgi:hypothetical protein